MKKLLILPILALSPLLALSLCDDAFAQVNAAFDTKNVTTDVFDGDLSNSWSLVGGASLEHQYSSLRLKPKTYNWGSSLTLNRPLNGDFTVKMTLTSLNDVGWFGVAFGSVNNSTQFSGAKGGLVFFDNQTSVLSIVGGELKVTNTYSTTAFAPTINTKRKVEINVHQMNEQYSSMTAKVYEDDVFVMDLLPSSQSFNNLNGYMSFNTSSKDVEIFELEVLDSLSQRLYYDDFSSSKVLYPTSGSGDSEWYSNGFDEEELKVGYINYLALNHTGDGALYHQPLETMSNSDLDIVYELKSEIRYSSMGFGGESGFEIGKASETSNGYFFGIRRLVIGYALVTYQVGSTSEQKIETYNESPNLRVNLELYIHNNGDIDVVLGELSDTVHVSSFSGYFGLFNYDHLNSHPSGSGAFVHSFILNKTNYYDRSGADVYMNFNGTKQTYWEDIGEYTYDYFLSRREWNMGTNVSLSKWNNKDHGDGKLEFNSATGTSIFGPKVMYKDFVVKFDVEITSETVPYGGSLGLEFGSNRAGIFYDNSKSLGIGYYPDESHEYMTVAVATHMNYFDESTRYCKDELGNKDIFKTHGKFTLMYVCQDNVVSMYYQLSDESEMTLSKERTSVYCNENESTDGYLSIFGANGISFTVDNLSIINLDYETPEKEYDGQSDYQEVTRADFANESTLNGISYQNASISSEKLNISNGGSLFTNKITNDGILRLSIEDIENELVIRQGSLSISLINRANKAITISDSGGSQEYDLNDDFDFYQSLIEIKKISNKVVLRLKEKDTPLSSIGKHEISFEIHDYNNDYLIIESKGGTASISKFTFVNLNRYATIKNRDYNPDTDSFDPWSPKTPIQEEEKKKKGCGGSIIASSIFVSVFAALGVVLIYIRKKGGKAHV